MHMHFFEVDCSEIMNINRYVEVTTRATVSVVSITRDTVLGGAINEVSTFVISRRAYKHKQIICLIFKCILIQVDLTVMLSGPR